MSGGELARGMPLIIGAMCGCGVAQLPFFTAGAFMIPLQKSMGWSRMDVSLGLAASTLAMAVGGPVAGRLAERFGTRRVAITSLSIMALGFFAMSLLGGAAWHYILAMGVISLLGAGAAPITFTRAVNVAFERYRGLALGLTLAGIGIAGMLGPWFAQTLIGAHGWRTGYLGVAGAFATSAPLVAWLVKDEKSQHPGFDPSHIRGEGAAWRGNPAFWTVGVAFFLVTLAMAGPIVHFIPILIDARQSAEKAATTAGTMGIAIVLGSLACGWALDRLFAPRVAIVVFGLTTVGCLLLDLAGSHGSIISGFLLGTSLGAVVDVLSFITARYFGTSNYGVTFGILYGLFSIAGAIGPVLTGLIDDRTGSYAPSLMLSAALSALSCLIIGRLGPYPVEMPHIEVESQSS